MEKMIKNESIIVSAANDENYGADKFAGDSVVLIQLNKLPVSHETYNLVEGIDCKVVEKYVIKQRKEVFETVYDFGKIVYKYLSVKHNYSNLSELINPAILDKETITFLKNIFNEFVQNNGYPYMIEKLPHIDDNVPIPDYLEFINESITIYIIEELRRWIIKLRIEETSVGSNNFDIEYVTSRTNKAVKLFNLLKSELIASLMNRKCSVIYDNISENEVIQLLQKGFPIIDKKTPLTKKVLLEFLTILQRTLIIYVIEIINGTYKNQYNISKRLPIFNSTSDQYRLYIMAHSLMGIGYDYLLSGLTVSKISFERAICNYPDCNNEFEKDGTGKYCPIHQDDEYKRKHIKHKSYLKNKNKQKKN